MGNQRQYNPDGGFSEYLYASHPDWEPAEVNGLRGKVVRDVTDLTGCHSGLPAYANTSHIYFKLDDHGCVEQARAYLDRRKCLDFDWGHVHPNKKGEKLIFEKGVIHVHEYVFNSKKEIEVRSSEARYMTDDEIAKYGPIIHHFNPDVKFRP